MIYKILVSDMHCENCVKRIKNALTETEIDFTVDLFSKTITLNGCEHCLSTIIAKLEDLGFTPKNIN